MKLKAYAKINLTLDCTGVRSDGYHLLKMIMQSVGLCDEVTLRQNAGGITLTCNNAALPTNEKNIAYAAAARFYEAAGITPAVDIHIEKRIPAAAGVGGGSADAAAVLYGLNRMHDRPLSEEKLAEVALTLGADVPFCLSGGTALAEGIGEKLVPLPDMPHCGLVLIKPCDKPSTGAMYGALDALATPFHPNTDGAISALGSGDLAALADTFGNSFDPVWQGEATEMAKADLMNAGAIGASLSGSGPTVFGIFKDIALAKSAADALREKYDLLYVAAPVNCGVEIITEAE